MFRRLLGWPPERIRDQMQVNETWYLQAEALTFQAQETVARLIPEAGLMDAPQLTDGASARAGRLRRAESRAGRTPVRSNGRYLMGGLQAND